MFLGPVLLAVALTLFQDWGRDNEAAPDHPGEFERPQGAGAQLGLLTDPEGESA